MDTNGITSPLIPIAQTKKPFLIVYGNGDGSCVYCDVFYSLPWRNPNVSIKEYDGLNHTFFDSMGNSHWERVTSDIDWWIENNE